VAATTGHGMSSGGATAAAVAAGLFLPSGGGNCECSVSVDQVADWIGSWLVAAPGAAARRLLVSSLLVRLGAAGADLDRLARAVYAVVLADGIAAAASAQVSFTDPG
jgi:hypothetical protein